VTKYPIYGTQAQINFSEL